MFGMKSEPSVYPGYPKLPGTLRPGAIVGIQPGEILRYDGLDLTVVLPKEELVMEAVSSMDIFGMRIARAYAKVGDVQVLFQFNQDKNGNVEDINCFQILQEIFPATQGDWETWLGDTGLIGGADLNAPNGKAYTRDWGDGAHAEPVEAEEKIFLDPTQPPITVKHRMMLYSRPLGGDDREFMLLSADEENGQALVRALAGVVMNPVALNVY